MGAIATNDVHNVNLESTVVGPCVSVVTGWGRCIRVASGETCESGLILVVEYDVTGCSRACSNTLWSAVAGVGVRFTYTGVVYEGLRGEELTVAGSAEEVTEASGWEA